MKQIVLVLASILWLAFSAPSAARAEGFVDLRVGGAFTEESDVEVTIEGIGAGSSSADIEDSVTGGLRGGYWLDVLPFVGLAADVSYFAADDEDSSGEIDVIPLSPLLMLRLPIAESEEFPHGQFQPFVGVGPGIFVTSIDDTGGYEDDSVDVGADVHAGLKVLVTPSVALFVQYRFTTFEAEFSDTVPTPFGIRQVDLDLDIDTHHAAAGIGFHF